jgi:hypothetical protein
MQEAARAFYRAWVSVLFVAIVVQVALAGYGSFYAAEKTKNAGQVLTHHQFDHGFSAHDALGYLIFLASIVLVLIALGARLGRRGVLLALAVPVLVLIQILLAIAGENTPAVGVLHPVNGFLILGLVGMLTHRAWRAASEPAAGVR